MTLESLKIITLTDDVMITHPENIIYPFSNGP